MRVVGILVLFCLGLFGADGAKIYYTKSFPKSFPAFAAIELSRDGSGIYRDAPDDQAPVKFTIPEADAAKIFELADKLDHFKKPLESNLKVAFMGMKTFRYENGTDTGEAKFNYSLDEDARAIADWFEKMIATQQAFLDLERTAKFDKLGVNKSLLELEIAFDKKRLVGCDRFLPLLDRIAKNESYLHMDRERAASLATVFRSGPQQKSEQ